RTLSESALHASAQSNGGLPESIAELIGSRQNVLPFFTTLAFQKIQLWRILPKRRCLHAQQSYLCSFTPIGVKKPVNILVDFVIELRRRFKRMGAGNGSEILVSQLELQSARA